MGYLERKALKRCQALIGPYAEPGEPVEEPGEPVEDFDVGWFGGGKIDLINRPDTVAPAQWRRRACEAAVCRHLERGVAAGDYGDVDTACVSRRAARTWRLRFALPEG